MLQHLLLNDSASELLDDRLLEPLRCFNQRGIRARREGAPAETPVPDFWSSSEPAASRQPS